MISGLHAILTGIASLELTITPDRNRGKVFPIRKGKRDLSNFLVDTLFLVPGKVFVHLLLMWIRR